MYSSSRRSVRTPQPVEFNGFAAPQLEAEVQGVGFEESEAREPSPKRMPRGSTESVLAKVNRAHKGLVRKEVWRQKFDFLYKLVEAEMKYDKNNPNTHSDNPAAASAKLAASVAAAVPSGCSGARDRLASNVSEAADAVAGCQRAGSRPGSASHSKGFAGRPRSCSGTSATGAASQLAASRGDLSSVADDPSTVAQEQRREAWGQPPSSAVAAARGGWCKTGKSYTRQNTRPQRRNSAAGKSRRSPDSSELCPSSKDQTALPRLLSGSSSLPLLATERRARELCGIKDEYYAGDELFMHEDILFSSNPNLFPLRPASHLSHTRPFPLFSLEAYNGHAEAAW